MKLTPLFVRILTLAVATLWVATAPAQTPNGTLLFNDPFDAIAVDGQTVIATTSTYEAWVFFPDGTTVNGALFTEWTDFQEDKDLAVGPTSAFGYNHFTGVIATYSGANDTGVWHHFAFVTDTGANQESIYLDGERVFSSSASGDVSDGPGPASIGAIFRDGAPRSSFYGFVDSLRLSGTARYSGDSIAVPANDMPADDDTLLLYQFNKEDFFVDNGATKITDLSGNDRTGTLASGFDGATAPAAPARQGDVDCNGSLTATDALGVLRVAVGLKIKQSEPCPDVKELLTTGIFGDVDCSGSVLTTDALKVLRIAVHLDALQGPSCVPFGDPV